MNETMIALGKELHCALGFNRPICCIDIGATALGNPETWNLLTNEQITEVIGFEPNQDECEKLNKNKQSGQSFLPYAVGDGNKHVYYQTNTLMTSSLLKPNFDVLDQYINLAELCRVTKEVPIQTKRMDDIPEIKTADFLKLDIQGGELMALRHATELLKSVAVVQTEVEFAELYCKQPLFGDIDQFMRAHGFMFHRFAYLMGRPYKRDDRSYNEEKISQVLWGDAIYVRDIASLEERSSEQISAMVFILSTFFKSHDLSMRLLEELERRGSSTAKATSAITKIMAIQKSAYTQASQSPISKSGLIKLKTKHGIDIFTPDNINSISTYVILEKETWFEDELPFLISIAKENDFVVDIGANYGIYTLPLAAKIGKHGKVFSFEPASETAKTLEKSIAANQLSQRIVLNRAAVGKESCKAKLSIESQSELNSVADSSTHLNTTRRTEDIDVFSLDDWIKSHQLEDSISIMKIDAEGQESAILQGGAKFFATQSPLVMYEIKAGSDMNLGLINEFSELGYDSYSFVPGINAAVPVRKNTDIDSYCLNLLACKPDRAEVLANRGYLLTRERLSVQSLDWQADSEMESIRHWQQCDYVKLLDQHWQQQDKTDNSRLYQAIGLYYFSTSLRHSLAERYESLMKSFNQMEQLLSESTSDDCLLPRLSSFARVSRAVGFRVKSVNALQSLCSKLLAKQPFSLNEPFLISNADFDNQIVLNNRVAEFVLASTLYQLNELASYSSFYSPKESLGRIELIERTGYGNKRTTWIRSLINKRINSNNQTKPTSASQPST
ncbi:MAG: FkbM family methyltransferase [Chitinophagaceae bacterium]|nr:FkbM family methyltransferase [Chitinophagaceae bacterium]